MNKALNATEAGQDALGATSVAVIGAGIVGVATALNLLRKGVDVTLIDEREPGEGASYGNAGIAAPCAIVPVPVPGIVRKMPSLLMDPLGPLSLDPLYILKNPRWFLDYVRHGRADEVERIAGELFKLTEGAADEHVALARGTKADGLVGASDYYYVYSKREDFLKEAFAWDIRTRHGIMMEEVADAELRELEPDLSPAFKFAIRLPRHGYSIDPGKLVKGLARSFREGGGKVLRAKVRAFEQTDGAVDTVVTDQGKLRAGKVVVAAGAWSLDLLKPFGLNIPLMSERGYHVEFRDTGIRHNNPLMITSGKYVATPMDGRLRLAGMVEFRKMSDDPNPKLWDRLKRHAGLLFPDADLSQMETWMGHRPSLPDSLPVIGPLQDHPNVILAFGHQHIGLTTGPKTGRLVAQIAAGETPNIDISAFSATRFG